MIRYAGIGGGIEEVITKLTGNSQDKVLKGIEFSVNKPLKLTDYELINKNKPFDYEKEFFFNCLNISGRHTSKVYLDFTNTIAGKGRTITMHLSQVVDYLRKYVED